jgi:hypothetical protein
VLDRQGPAPRQAHRRQAEAHLQDRWEEDQGRRRRRRARRIGFPARRSCFLSKLFVLNKT